MATDVRNERHSEASAPLWGLMPLPLLALTFGTPALLWGLGLSAAPLIIHLLHKRRYRTIDWAAVEWLLEAMRKNYRRIRLEQWLLLAIRTLILVLLVLAMAKPLLEQASRLLAAASSAEHLIIVFDNSMSMHYTTANRSRWESAKGMAQAILDDAQKGDLASVVVMGASATVLVGQPSPYLTTVSEEIDALGAQHAATQIEPAIDRVLQILRASPAAQKHVYVITDMQKSTWHEPAAGRDSVALGRKLLAIAEQAECTILDTSGPESPNLAVVALELAEPLVVHRRPAVVRASIANHSSQPRPDVRVELLVDEQVEATELLSLPAGEQRSVSFAVVPEGAGDRVIEVRLPDDPLRADNRRWLVADVRESLSVLLVDGEPSGEPFQSETDYLHVALAPAPSNDTESLIHCETRFESDLLSSGLDEHDLVVLANVGQLTATEASVLRDYLRGGGGVLFWLGTQTAIQPYNEVLFQEGKGILPVKLLDVVGDEDRRESYYTFDPLGYQHPIVQPFRDAEQAGLLTAKVFRYLKSELPAESTVEVALAYSSGDPAVVLAPFEQGRVGVVTTSADLDWNTWAISPSFVPVVHELVRQLVSGRVRRAQTRVGEPLTTPVPRASSDSPVQLTLPGGASVQVPVEDRQGVGYLKYDATDLAGIYRARLGSPIDREWALAVNPWPQESNLSKLTADDLRSLVPGWRFTLLNQWSPDRSPATAGFQHRGELFRPILYALLALLFLETFLAWRFAHYH